jgi:hypothetical protein
MKMKLVNQPELEQNIKAWLHSRPNENPDDLSASVFDLDLPVNEFAQVVVQITSTVLEREILATLRDHTMWAQTSRVQDVLKFEMSEFVPKEFHYDIERARKGMEMRSEAGHRQDDYRLELPIFSETSYTMAFSMRRFVKIALYFEQLALDEEMSHLKDMFCSAWDEFIEISTQCGIPQSAFTRYKPLKILNEKEVRVDPPTHRSATIFTITKTVPFNLRSQLVRHRGIGFSDNLLELMKDGFIFKADQVTMITVKIWGAVEDFQEIVDKRSCWVAHNGIWKSFIEKIRETVPVDFNLPCDGGSCPFKADVVLRYEGKDPNPCCPKFCNLEKLSVSREMRKDMFEMIYNDKRDLNFWEAHILKTEEK